jgi:excisionase family DNA binding protein
MSTPGTSNPEPNQPMTLAEAAAYLRIGKTQLFKLITGQLPGPAPRHARAGRRIIFKRAWLDQWLEDSASANASQTNL